MTLDHLFEELDTVFALAEQASGPVGGFLHLVPSQAGKGYSLSAMRRRPATPNGLMEFLIAEAMSWAKQAEVAEISLNFCVFADALRAGRNSPLRRRALCFGLLNRRLDVSRGAVARHRDSGVRTAVRCPSAAKPVRVWVTAARKSPISRASYDGPGGTRTRGLGIKSPLLCQLSYRPFGRVCPTRCR
jgi:phosphatidylglycerol lysyltransferase-like protein